MPIPDYEVHPDAELPRAPEESGSPDPQGLADDFQKAGLGTVQLDTAEGQKEAADQLEFQTQQLLTDLQPGTELPPATQADLDEIRKAA